MKILFIILLCLCQVQKVYADNLIPINNLCKELYNGDLDITTAGSMVLERPLDYFYPILYVDFFMPLNKETYKNNKFTYVIKTRYPIIGNNLLGIRLRINIKRTTN